MNIYQKSRAVLAIRLPFFASLMMNTPVQFREDIPTAATDGKTLFYNKAYVETLTVEQALGLHVHELCHIFLMHSLRKQARDHQRWNHAADYTVNHMITELGLSIPPSGLLDPRYTSSAEVIYDMLASDPASMAKGAGPLGGDVLAPESQDAAGLAELEQAVRQKIAQAATMARLTGTLTGTLAKLVTAMMEPQVPWQTYLRDYMTRVSRDDESWSRRNRRVRDYYLPSKLSMRMGKIGVIRDISGSVSYEEQAKTIAEIVSISETTRPEAIHVVAADTDVRCEQIFVEGEPVVIDAVDGGGTDMRVPLAFFEEQDVSVVVLITDGYTPWPDREPGYPLIVCCTTDVDVPIGLTVRLS